MNNLLHKNNRYYLPLKIYPTSSSERELSSLYLKSFPQDTLFQFFSYFSNDLIEQRDNFKKNHPNSKNEFLQQIINKQENFLFSTFRESVNILLVSVPDTGKEEDKNFFKTLKDTLYFLKPEEILMSLKEFPFTEAKNKMLSISDFSSSRKKISEIREYLSNDDNYFLSFSLLFNKNTYEETVKEHGKYTFQHHLFGPFLNFFPNLEKKIKNAYYQKDLMIQGDVPLKANLSVGTTYKTTEESFHLAFEELKRELLVNDFEFKESSFKDIFESLPLETFMHSDLSKVTPFVEKKNFGKNILNFIDRNNEIVGADIFNGNNNNFLTVGCAGSGKGVLISEIISNYLITGAKIRIIDRGHSYEKLNKFFDGKYIDVKNKCFNFFTKISTKNGELLEEEKYNLIKIILLMASVSGDKVKEVIYASYIDKAILKAFIKKSFSAGMEDVIDGLKELKEECSSDVSNYLNEIILALAPFGKEGLYYSYFNGENNVDFDNNFIVFDFDSIDNETLLTSVLLSVISNDVSQEFYWERRDIKKILIIDELFYFDKKIFSIIEDLGRRLRKYNASLGLVLSSFEDINQYIYNLFDNKFVLQHSIGSNYSILKSLFTSEQVEEILMLKTKIPHFSEFAFVQGYKFSVCRLCLSKPSLYLYSNSYQNTKELKEAEEVGVSLKRFILDK